MTQPRTGAAVTRNTRATSSAPVRRRPGDTQSILVVALTIAATAIAFYDLMLLALAMR